MDGDGRKAQLDDGYESISTCSSTDVEPSRVLSQSIQHLLSFHSVFTLDDSQGVTLAHPLIELVTSGMSSLAG